MSLGQSPLGKYPLGSTAAAGLLQVAVAETASAVATTTSTAAMAAGVAEAGSASDNEGTSGTGSAAVAESGSAADSSVYSGTTFNTAGDTGAAAETLTAVQTGFGFTEHGFAADTVTTTFAASTFFSTAVQALLKGDTLYATYGVQFNFASGSVAVWQGIGPIDASAFSCPVFSGVGNMGKIGSLEMGVVAGTQSVEFELSGLDATFFAKSQSQQSEVRGRRCTVFILFFNSSATLIDCRVRKTYVMDRIVTNVSADGDTPSMICKLSAEPILAPKNQSTYSFLTDADQRARFPGDRGLERTQLLTNRMTLVW